MSSKGGVQYKVVLLGNSGVGKSNLLNRLYANQFSEDFLSTIGVEFVTKVLDVGGEKMKVQIWDTAGQERYAAMMGTYYRKAMGAVLVYDVVDQESFAAVENWRKELMKHAEPDVRTILVANKMDLVQPPNVRPANAVNPEKAKSYAEEKGMTFMETSAKTGENVTEAFLRLAEDIYAVAQQTQDRRAPAPQVVNLADVDGKKHKQDCCG